jgi:hypothetical protein
MTTAFERRCAEVEAALDELAPRPSEYDRFIAENPWIEWMTCAELTELEQIYRRAEDVGEATAADEKRALAIRYASEARMLAGEPKDCDKPPEPFDIQASYEASKRAAEAKWR